MILDIPEEAFNCYGPCPGFENAEADAKAESAVRLAKLADVAEAAEVDWSLENTCSADVIDSNLQALESLGIVEVGQLLIAEPEVSPNCYNLPCSEDIQEAEELTCERAARLASIVANSEDI